MSTHPRTRRGEQTTQKPVLVVLGGLPGTGKTTVARGVAQRLRAAHVRVDAIETALVESGLATDQAGVGPAGYVAAERVVRSCLEAGTDTVVDAVHQVAVSRSGWPGIAHDTGAVLLTVLLSCLDRQEHARRVTERQPDLAGHVLPSWGAVSHAEMEPWPDVHLELDTTEGPQAIVDVVVAAATHARVETLRQH